MNRACSRPALKLWAVLLAIAVSDGAGTVLAQPAPSLGSRTADPVVDAARSAFESLPETDRRAIQEGLIWSGDYSGTADGTFGRQTFEAIAAYQRRSNRPATGALAPAERAALAASAQSARNAARFDIIDDARTGIRIGVPLKLLPNQSDNPSGGSRWQSADGKVTLDTRVAPADATLPSLYERNIAIKTPGRIVSYKVLRPDFFVIAGETPTGRFYTRYASGGSAGIRAFSIGYDKSVAPQFDRLVVAIANSFEPFPTAPRAAAPAPVAAAPAQPAIASSGLTPFGTGLVVGRRQVITAAPLDRCKDARVGTMKVQQVKGKGPFVLELAQDLAAKPASSLAAGRLEPGRRVLVIASGNDGDGARLNVIAGTGEDATGIVAALQPGASGAPVFDPNGTLVGFVGALPPNPRRVAGIVPSARYEILPATDLAESIPSLKNEAKTSAQALSAADLVSLVRPSVVSISCDP